MKTCKYCGYGVMKDPLSVDGDSWIHSRSFVTLCNPFNAYSTKKAEPVS